MKKLIFWKFFKDLTLFFITISLSISLIIWVIQAVNYLDMVSDDGHSFQIYFLYTLLSLPKIFSKVLPFVFFISLFYIILKYERNNELIIFWMLGIHKSHFVNTIIKFTLLYLVLQFLLIAEFSILLVWLIMRLQVIAITEFNLFRVAMLLGILTQWYVSLQIFNE